jgi:hypothetical protein
LAGSLTVVLSIGCATSSPPPEDRFSPAHMKNGPSMYETGRFGTVPLSSGGLKVEDGAIDRRIDPRPVARTAPARSDERQRGKHKPRARAQRQP